MGSWNIHGIQTRGCSVRSALLLLIVAAMALSAAQPTFAVLDFHGEGMPLAEARDLSAELRTAVSEIDSGDVMAVLAMAGVLADSGFDAHGCTQPPCARKAGSYLEVPRVIVGCFTRDGANYTARAHMVSVDGYTETRTVALDFQGGTQAAVTEGLRALTRRLLGHEPEARTPDAPSATVFISSIPTNVSVYMDGELIGETNAVFLPVTAGTHEMRFVKGDCELTQTMVFAPGKNPSIAVRLPCELLLDESQPARDP